MVEVIVNGKSLDLENEGKGIKHTIQIADIFDIASVSSSYTNSFQVPKTDRNTEIFNMLGISGDTSRIPYEIIKASIKEDGFDIVSDGILNISETSNSYKISVINGIIELFKSMENKTIGIDLNLENFNHEKNIQTVTESITNDYYKYIVADYGGKKYTSGGINIDYLSPSFSVQKLLELIFQTFGWQVDFTGISDFIENLFITYPLATSVNPSEAILSADLKKLLYVTPPINVIPNVWEVSQIAKEWDPIYSIINEGSITAFSAYVVPVASAYTLNLKIQGYALYRGRYLSTSNYARANVTIEKNNIPIIQFMTDPYEITEREISVFAEPGDIFNVRIFVNTFVYGAGQIYETRLREFHILSTDLNIKRINQGNISLTNAMKSFKITDFLKEIIWRTGVTPILSRERVVSFLTIEERLSYENAIDWTDKYISRSSENYIKNSYAQRNLFKMKYNNEGQDTNNGVLLVNNKNIDAEKTLAQTQLYAPESYTSEFVDVNGLNPTDASVLPMWRAEPKDDGNGLITIDYKPLDNRFYFLRYVEKTGNYKLASDAVVGEENVSLLLFSNTERTLFDQLIPLKYSQYEKIFDDFRSRDIELFLGASDIANIDLTKIYYFAQEGAYFMINKVTYQASSVSKSECIRIIPNPI